MQQRLVIILAMILIGVQVSAQQTKTISVGSFSEVKFEGSAKWVLIPSDEEKVVIETSKPEVYDFIEVDNNGNALVINTIDKSKRISQLFKSVTIKVYFTSLEKIQLSGVGSVDMEGRLETSMLSVDLRGTGSMNLSVLCNEFDGKIHGTGYMELEGEAENCVVNVEGVGGFNGYDFVTQNMNVVVSGVGHAHVNASQKLIATINGVGSIKYKGDPEVKNLNSNGLGNIKKY